MATKKEIGDLVSYDFSVTEQATLNRFIEDGLKGYSNVRKDKKDKWYRLYKVGKNYQDISKITSTKIEAILYASYELKWTEARDTYYLDLASSALSHIKNIHSQSVKTMSTIVSAYSLYFEEKFGKYISKKDQTLIENVDPKMLSQYYKSLEVMSKMFTGDSGKNNLAMNISQPPSKKEKEKEEAIEVEFSDDNYEDVMSQLASKGMK